MFDCIFKKVYRESNLIAYNYYRSLDEFNFIYGPWNSGWMQAGHDARMGKEIKMALILKQDENGNATVTDEGKIIYLDDANNNQELPLDPAAMYSKISKLGKENQGHRTAKQELESSLSNFEGITDLAEYRKTADAAIAKVANFNDEDWMKADKVEKLKGEISDAYEDKLRAKDEAITGLKSDHENLVAKKDTHINRLMISNRFAISPHFIAIGENRAKTTLPPDIGESQFGKHFRVEEQGEDLVLRAYMGGEQVLSKVNPGEPAGFEEALSLIIDSYPGKNNILPASPSGSGGQGGGQGAGDHDELTQLQTQYKAAMESGQSQLAINLKNRIFKLNQKLKKSA